jgi:UDP-N-acetyl-D-mannosaminuronic acid transferase (WecB/TagA/CpsF family)
MKETISKIEHSIDTKTNLHHVVVNAAKMVNMQKDK